MLWKSNSTIFFGRVEGENTECHEYHMSYSIPQATAKALIRRTVTDPSPNRPRTAMAYEHFSWKADCIVTSNRADAVLLAGLRAGHTPLLKVYDHLLGLAADPACPLCKEAPQTLEHWLQRCPNLDVLRPHSESSRPTPRRCWRSLWPLSRPLGPRLTNSNNRRVGYSGQQRIKRCRQMGERREGHIIVGSQWSPHNTHKAGIHQVVDTESSEAN